MPESSPRFDARTVDAALVAAVAVVALIGLTAGHLAPRPDPAADAVALSGTLAIAQAAALWWRRSRPLLVLVVTLAAVVLAQAAGDANAASFLGPHVAAYSVAAYGPEEAWRGLSAMAVAAAADGAVIRWIDHGPSGPVLLGPTGALVLVAWGIGRYVRVRRQHLATLHAYARQLETERDQRAAEAVREERRRIARELHDQVAHQLGVVTLQTAAARRWLDRDATRTGEALRAAEDAARQALTTMPAILGALRADEHPADLEPQPGLRDLERLGTQLRDAGLDVAMSVQGPVRPLHPAVELTAYRLIQEALTNVMKHAGGAGATVELVYGADVLRIDVHDDGHGLAAASSSGGHGLIGMRERVELVGGRLTVGPRPGGGFSVSAALPTAATVSSP